MLSFLLSWLLVISSNVDASNILGFNYVLDVGSVDNWQNSFRQQQNLAGVPRFEAARIFTAFALDGSSISPAFQAAITTKTQLHITIPLDKIASELPALEKAVQTYQSSLTDLILGVSVGIHDLQHGSANATTIALQVNQVKSQLQKIGLQNVPVGHDEIALYWPASSVQTLLDACDFIGVEIAYARPSTKVAADSLEYAISQVSSVRQLIGTKELRILGYSWPAAGSRPPGSLFTPSPEGAEFVWDSIVCQNTFANIPFFWGCLTDKACATGPTNPAILNSNGTAKFDVSCDHSSTGNASAGGNSSAIIPNTNNTQANETANSTQNNPNSNSNPNGLPLSAKIGIGVGVSIGGVLAIVLIFYLVQRRRKQLPGASKGGSSIFEKDCESDRPPANPAELDIVGELRLAGELDGVSAVDKDRRISPFR